MDSVARGTAINLLARIGSVLAMLALTVWTARLGPQAQGAFALFTGVEGVLLALCSGLGVALARVPAQGDGRTPHEAASALDARRGTALGCLILGALATPALWALELRGGVAYQHFSLLALAAPLLLLTPNLAGWWLGEGRMRPLAWVTLAPPGLALVGVLSMAAGGWHTVLAVLLAWVLAKGAVGAVLAVALLTAPAGAEPTSWARSVAAAGRAWAWLRGQAGFVLTIGATNVVGLLNYRVGLFVVERTLGLAVTGIFSIAVVVAELLWLVSSALTQAVYGRLGGGDAERATALTLRVLQLAVLALLTLAPPLALVAWLLLPWLLGPEYAAAVPLLALLLPGAVLFGGASALSAWFTQHRGQPQVPAQVAALSLALNFVLSLLWAPRFGAPGVALAASLAYAFTMGLLAWRFARAAGLPLAALWRPGPRLGSDLTLLWRSLASLARR
jgi:O-antigen/teichoic acid export membrane protein